jgi:hypothetical protein
VNLRIELGEIDISDLANLDVTELLAELIAQSELVDFSSLITEVDLSGIMQLGVQIGPEKS